MIIEQNSQRQIVYYWFEQRGLRIENEWWSKWYLLTDAITKNRTDGALIRLTTPIYRNENEVRRRSPPPNVCSGGRAEFERIFAGTGIGSASGAAAETRTQDQ